MNSTQHIPQLPKEHSKVYHLTDETLLAIQRLKATRSWPEVAACLGTTDNTLMSLLSRRRGLGIHLLLLFSERLGIPHARLVSSSDQLIEQQHQAAMRLLQ